MDDEELQDIASVYGDVLQQELHKEGSYKCGWVEYATKKEALACVGELNEREMDEWSLMIQAYCYPGGHGGGGA